MNARHILFRTSRFNLSVTKPHFINPDCFGEDLADWLKNKFVKRGTDVGRLGQEDWGWYLEVKNAEDSYLLGMNGIRDEASSGEENLGEWRIIVKENRSLGQWLGGEGRKDVDDAMLTTIEEILRAEPDFNEVHQGD
jgi:hypothetical protein